MLCVNLISYCSGLPLPNKINVVDLAKDRAAEIDAMTAEVAASKFSSTRRTFQQISRHMRRRAASHDIRRLPRRLRERALEELKLDPECKKSTRHKKNCRHWRRRPQNIQDSKPGWLPTHIWHAKRFKMAPYWGTQVALHQNEKCLKSCLRAYREGALLHDFSYWKPFTCRPEGLNSFLKAHAKKRTGYFPASMELCTEYLISIANVFVAPIFTLERKEYALIWLHPAVASADSLAVLAQHGLALVSKGPVSLSTFVIYGKQSKSALSSILSETAILHPDGRAFISDPRCAPSIPPPMWERFEHNLFNPSVPPSDATINEAKSGLLLTEAYATESAACAAHVFLGNDCTFITLPSVWARQIWYALVRVKPVKVAGIENMEHAMLENFIPRFPQDFVQSSAFHVHAELQKTSLQDSHLRKPPAKRAYYGALGAQDPFMSDFSSITDPVIVRLVVHGRGTLQPRAHVFNSNGRLIGHVTSALSSSISMGCSIALATVCRTLLPDAFDEIDVSFKNLSSFDITRAAKLKII